MTTTPKRKRGQRAKRHPWSNAVGPIMRAWKKWRNTMDLNGWSDRDKRLARGAFMAGYRAGLAKR